MTTSVRSILAGAGLRSTKQRIALYEQLSTRHKPQSIATLAAALSKRMDTVTIYRILDSFIRAGLVRQVDLRQGSPLFELIDERDHHHIVCTECSRVEDFEGCYINSLTKNALKQSSAFSSIQSHSIELFGLCTSCTR